MAGHPSEGEVSANLTHDRRAKTAGLIRGGHAKVYSVISSDNGEGFTVNSFAPFSKRQKSFLLVT